MQNVVYALIYDYNDYNNFKHHPTKYSDTSRMYDKRKEASKKHKGGADSIKARVNWIFPLVLVVLLTGCNTSYISSSSTQKSKVSTTQTNSSRVSSNATQQDQSQDSAGKTDTLKTVSFINLNRGWIAFGNEILSTKDGGLHWNKVSYLKSDVYDMDFLNENMGWLSSGEGLFRTIDGGETWQQATNLKDITVTHVQFVNQNDGWVYGYNGDKFGAASYYFLRTTNAGETWTSIITPEPNLFGSLAYFFITPNQGWLMIGSQPGAGNQGKTIYKTIDGGESWSKIASASMPPNKSDGLPIGGYVSDLFFFNDEHGWFTESRGEIYVTTDGGNTWKMVDKHPTKEWFMSKPFFENSKEGYVLSSESGNPSLLGTKDGGETWEPIFPMGSSK